MSKSLKDILCKCKSEDALEMLKEYAELEDISFIKPVSSDLINSFEKDVAKFPTELKKIYEFTNGFFSPMFDLLPIFDKNNVKRTWDSINRANSEKNTFNFSREWLNKFCIFGRFDGKFAAAFDKEEYKFWIEFPDGNMHRQSGTLRDFLLIGLESY